MSDPSQSVHEQLLPHVHLLNTYRFPTKSRVDIPEVTQWLVHAPKIARDTAPFYWTYLDRPSDGFIIMTWQPLQRLKTEFASDGYIWSGETLFTQEVPNGLVLECYFQKAGYAPGEPFATHSRRRFRLVPGNAATPNAPQVDPSLWIVHYAPVDNNERIPANMIPVNPRTNMILQQRAQLQQFGEIHRKEFMLSDRVNWPQLSLPRESARQPFHPGQSAARPTPQQMAYPHTAVGPAPKRARHSQGHANQQHFVGAGAAMEAAYDDDEDTSHGDIFDLLTPREVSRSRYQLNHEWMEEITLSAYSIRSIIPSTLGFGLKGELGPLTDGIFEAQAGEAVRGGPKKPYVGRLPPGLADEFRKRCKDHVESTEAEIKQMEAEHAERIANLKANSFLKKAEHDLRYAAHDSGSEFWRLEGRVDDSEENMGRWGHKQHKTADEIAAHVETSLGKQSKVVHDVSRIQDGGFQERAPDPVPERPVSSPPKTAERLSVEQGASMSRQASQSGSHQSGLMIGDSDVDMGGTAAGLLDQMHTGMSSTSTPLNNFPTPQAHLSAMPSNAATPAQGNVPSPQPGTLSADHGQGQQNAGGNADSAGGNVSTAPDQGTGSGDWVVVPQGGVSPIPTSGAPGGAANTVAKPGPSSKPTSAAPTPGVGETESTAFDGDNNDFGSLDDPDSAGDALASFDAPGMGGTPSGMGDGLDLNMDLDDSAFGDAFHGVEPREEGDTPGGGL